MSDLPDDPPGRGSTVFRTVTMEYAREVDRLEAEIERLTRERDEALRERDAAELNRDHARTHESELQAAYDVILARADLAEAERDVFRRHYELAKAEVARLREAVRDAYREGWYVNAAVEDQPETYLADCEEVDWKESCASAALEPQPQALGGADGGVETVKPTPASTPPAA